MVSSRRNTPLRSSLRRAFSIFKERVDIKNTIQTGVDLMVTPVMMAGGGLMLIGVVLGIGYGIRRKMKKRRR